MTARRPQNKKTEELFRPAAEQLFRFHDAGLRRERCGDAQHLAAAGCQHCPPAQAERDIRPQTRAQLELSPQPLGSDPVARNSNYLTSTGDWVDFETTVSTSGGQIALAPGYLQREWEQDGRRYYPYRSEAKLLPIK